MDTDRNYSLHDLKIAAVSGDTFTDAEVLQIFLNVNIGREEEIGEACGIIGNYRPKLAETFAKIVNNDYLKARLTKKPQEDSLPE